jgi:hypothetical protein
MDCRILRGYKPSGDLYRYIYTQILEPGHPGKVLSFSCMVPFSSSPHGIPVSSVADFHPSRIPDPTPATKEKGGKIC